MSSEKYTIGVDFGTLSGRALVVRVDDGHELASAEHAYTHGVITDSLPGSDIRCPRVGAAGATGLRRRAAQRRAGGDREGRRRPRRRDRHRHRLHRVHHAAGAAPTARRCASCHEFADRPHAYVKLWKHHAAAAAGRPDQRASPPSAASRGFPATAA